MTDIAPVLSSAGLTPPSSPLSSYQNMNTSSQASNPQPIPRSRRLRHAKSPIFPSPEYRIPHTSLYQFPSDGSLASAYAAHSNPGSSLTDAKVFTAVIPPLAAVPPTEPLPRPPKQEVWEELRTCKPIEISENFRKSMPTRLGKNEVKAQTKVEVVVGIIKDVRAEKEAERQKRGLRRMKGNVGEAASTQTSPISISKTPPARPNLTEGSGLPTPGSTPPSSAKIITPPRSLHHPKSYQLPVRKLDFSKSNRSSYTEVDAATLSEEEEDDDDGGIAIDYVDEPASRVDEHQDSIGGKGRKPAALDLGKLSVSGKDLPRPDSPFVTSFTLQFDEFKGVDETEVDSPTQYGYGSEDEGVRLSACKRSFPEFHTPTRVDSDKAEVVDVEGTQPDNPKAEINAKGVVATEESLSGVGNDNAVVVPSKDTQLDSPPTEDSSKEKRNTKNEKSKANVDTIINRSSILKRRHPSNPAEDSKKAIEDSEKLISPPLFLESWEVTCKSSTQVTTPSIITPPQLPRFNFIPATPLPVMSPTSVFDKQLGEHSIFLIGTAIAGGPETRAGMLPIPTDTTPAAAKPARPSMTRSKTVRESRLHPWWRPKNYYLEEEANFAKLLEGTSFTQGGEKGVPSELDFESMNTKPQTPKAEWVEYGPVRVDKKRKLVGVGGVQIQWVGLGGWYERIAGGKKGEGEKGEKGDKKEGTAPGKNVNLKRKGWIDF